jgi:hypothetical protein
MVKFGSLVLALPALALSALPALAQSQTYFWWWRPRPTSAVPEIDASTGIVAIAAVLAATALVWERSRRARG